MQYSFKPRGVCTQQMNFTIEDGIVTDVAFIGGCNGNLQGIARLVKGHRPEEIIERLQGICCDGKPTSCPDQFSKALQEALEQMQADAGVPSV